MDFWAGVGGGAGCEAVEESGDAFGLDDEGDVDRGGGFLAEGEVVLVVLFAQFRHTGRDEDAATGVGLQDLHQVEGAGEAGGVRIVGVIEVDDAGGRALDFEAVGDLRC